MHQKRTRSSRPKLFQCTGFGDCNMVFTRSEHLARHSRKHTGEKPFVCVVPLCTKAFSRFDNMMQHTQTHRNNNNYNIVTKERNATTARAQTTTNNKKSAPTAITTPKKSYHNNNLYIQTSTTMEPLGLVSPISLSSLSPKRQHTRQYSSSSSEEDEEEEDDHQIMSPTTPITRKRRLSVADLCNPQTVITQEQKPTIYLTKDEFEALEGFGRFRHSSPSVFFNSLKDLASNAHITERY